MAVGVALHFLYHPRDTTPSAVGDCVAAIDGESPGEVFSLNVKAKKISCSDPAAKFMVEKRIEGTDSTFTAAGLAQCPDGDVALTVDKFGGSGSWTLCLAAKS